MVVTDMLEMTMEEKPNGPGSIVHLDFSCHFQMHTVEKMKEELDLSDTFIIEIADEAANDSGPLTGNA